LTKNPTQHVRTKHIDVQHHFLWERVENGKIIFEYCSTKDMVVESVQICDQVIKRWGKAHVTRS
jgi:methyl coenzyme M reductase subunit D